MVNFVSIIALGFFLGIRHATDPDHVIAVTTIVSRERQIAKSAWIGIFWGLGHTLTIFVVGSAIILFNLAIPPRIGLAMEFAVGLMLVGLGVANVFRFLRGATTHSQLIHSHPHGHGDYVHSHPHGHEPEAHPHFVDRTPLSRADRVFSKFRVYQSIRPLVVGVVHGLAGSSAVALLVLTTIPDPHWAIAYLLVFGVGTIAGMMLITTSIAASFHMVRASQAFSRRLALASGLLSLGFGLVVAYRILAIHGLLSAQPHWTPQ